MNEIYLAAGCFWGAQAYFDRLEGVVETEVGYANGNTINPTYEEVCRKNTGFAETVRVVFDEKIIPLSHILLRYFKIIDPTVVDRQGPDIGNQYRTGIYYTSEEDIKIINEKIDELALKYTDPIKVEIKPLVNYYKAEEYHQKYLQKNPKGYCHIDLNLADEDIQEQQVYSKMSDIDLKANLTEEEYNITQKGYTERPFSGKYNNFFDEGIYVDITTGEPLFISEDKFDSGCGWPSFSKPISKEVIQYLKDTSHGMHRTEVRSANGDAHLGHVFNDGPEEMGGLRYCINSGALKFIPKENMADLGYGYLLKLFQ